MNPAELQEIEKEFFTQVPNTILKGYWAQRLSLMEKMFLIYVLSSGSYGVYRKARQTAADDLGMSVRSVSDAKKVLEDYGLIKVQVIPGSPDKITIPKKIWEQNAWDLKEHFKKEPLQEMQEGLQEVQGGLQEVQGGLAGGAHKKETIERNQERNQRENALSPTRAQLVDFFAANGGLRDWAHSFYDYYQSRNWQTTNGNSFDWQVRARQWIREDRERHGFDPPAHVKQEYEKTGINYE
ncbi:MAG: helix-turn-helix domain-containing protein [Spirochaeta sp.]|nr:helix-turn-helix domain-containing protein [Spirochaeta sp.]